MKKHIALTACLLTGLGTLGQAGAATVSYDLKLNNVTTYTGQTLARVTLSDNATSTGVDFTVTALLAGTKLDDFAFNFKDNTLPAGFALTNWPSGWNYTIDIDKIGGFNGFGKFDVRVVNNGASTRISPLTFSVTGGTVANYQALSSKGDSVFFSAHVTDFQNTTATVFAGGSSLVPVPAAAWLLGSGLIGLAGFARRRVTAKAV